MHAASMLCRFLHHLRHPSTHAVASCCPQCTVCWTTALAGTHTQRTQEGECRAQNPARSDTCVRTNSHMRAHEQSHERWTIQAASHKLASLPAMNRTHGPLQQSKRHCDGGKELTWRVLGKHSWPSWYPAS